MYIVVLINLALLWLQGLKSVKMLIYLPRYMYMYRVHFKLEHCQTYMYMYVCSTFTGQNELTVFDW